MHKFLGLFMALTLTLMTVPALAHEFHGEWHGGGESGWNDYRWHNGGHGFWHNGVWVPFVVVPEGYPCWRWYYGRWVNFC